MSGSPSKSNGPLLILCGFLLVLACMVLGSATQLLPDAPFGPTPTYPKGIDLPDSRPLPQR
jgi:hypothetical protein